MDAPTRSEIQTLVELAAAKLSATFVELGSHQAPLSEAADLLVQVSALITLVEKADLIVARTEVDPVRVYPPMTGWELD